MKEFTMKNAYKDKELLKTRNDYIVEYAGSIVGYISYQPDAWYEGKPYRAFYYLSDDASDKCFIDRFKTPYEAKVAIVKAFRECGRINKKQKSESVEFLPKNPNAEFYPTPDKLAGMMLAGIDWTNVSSVLEPSAGKGDLCEAIQKAYKNQSCFRYSEKLLLIDCVEIDTNLQHILNGNGFNVVYDDFLSFDTRKKYDVIVMNPPFSNGDEHLLKAIQMQKRYGGQIVCLLNAETIRNPYTDRRKLLLSYLNNLGASIQFVSNAFKKAERKTDVDVAIVRLSIPTPEKRSSILDDLKRAEEYKAKTNPETHRMLTSNNWIERMIGEYNFEVEAVTRLIEEYQSILPYIWNTRDTNYKYKKPILELKVLGDQDLNINRCLQSVRMKYWKSLFSQPVLTNKFTSNILSEYQARVEEMRDSDFNMFNIQKVLSRMNGELIEGVKESIEKLFETMTAEHTYYPECLNNIHYYTGWKTNKAHCVGKKVILPVNGFSAYSWKKNELDTYHCYEVLSDIEKVFNYLDGCMTDEVSLSNSLNRAEAEYRTKNIQCKYFNVTFYKKGTMHITFTVPRVVDALNIYMGKKKDWLPPYYGNISYTDLSESDRRTVDEFQGEKEYNKVYQNQSAYLIEITGNPTDVLLLSDKNNLNASAFAN